MPKPLAKLIIHPLTSERWADFERQKGAGHRRGMKKLVESGAMPGLLAYLGKEAVGWCAVAPRNEYPGLARSRILKPVDEQPVSSVSCLFVVRPHRRQGVSVAQLKAAVAHVRQHAGRIVEGYPQEPKAEVMPDVFAWTGLASAFREAGFKEVARPTPTRPIMRQSTG